MAESKSLLAHLTPWFYRPIEDRGTDALAYILDQSAACRAALDGLLRGGDFSPEPLLHLNTQVQYDDGKSRPDMVGYDSSHTERLLVESKFWAGLQPKQVSRYFGILEEAADGPGVLLVICPENRAMYLWPEVKADMEEGGRELKPFGSLGGTRRAEVVNSDKHLVMASWEVLLDRLDAVAETFEIRADIHQLRGLVQRQNDEAFPPLTPEMSAHSFEILDTYFRRMVRDAIGRGRREDWLSTKGLRWGVTKQHRRRFFSVVGVANPPWLALGIEYRQELYERTPLWVSIWRKHSPKVHLPPDAVTDTEIFCLPIKLKTGAVYDDVLNDVVSQLKDITDGFPRVP